MKFWDKYGTRVRSVGMILAGNFLYALAVRLFYEPAGFAAAGVTGIALAAQTVSGIPVSVSAAVLNAVFWLAGLFLLGRAFALSTLLSTVAYPVFLELIDRVLAGRTLTDSMVLCCAFAGVLTGIALGLVMREGSSTGGMDVVPLTLHKFWHVNISAAMNVCDIAILAAQILVYPAEGLLWGILTVLIYTVVLDKVLLSGTSRTELKIISPHHSEISEAIMRIADHGVTLLHAEGGYLHTQSELVLSIVSPRQVGAIAKEVQRIDPNAMLIVSSVTEVAGRGFTTAKEYK